MTRGSGAGGRGGMGMRAEGKRRFWAWGMGGGFWKSGSRREFTLVVGDMSGKKLGVRRRE